MRKYDRQRIILSLIEENEVETQDDLAALLKEQNIIATQATISRDIKELRLTKMQTTEGIYKYTVVETMHDTLNERLSKIFKSAILTIKRNRDRIIITTVSYAATVAALAITNRKIKGISAILAGHDTIIIEIEEGFEISDIKKAIEGMIL